MAGDVIRISVDDVPARQRLAYLHDFVASQIAGLEFEPKDAGEGRIAAAGFTAQSWRTAVDATMKGFYAALPQREIDAAFEGADAFETRADFSAEQKEAMRQLVSEWRARMYEWRDEGADDAATVEPYVNEIRVLLDAW